MEVRRTRRIACKAALLALLALPVFALSSPPAGARGVPMARAEQTARQAVLQHSSYREIGAARTPLVTRSCWRAAARAVRCSLYVEVPNPCTLDPGAEKVCAQALWQRRWLVEVKRGAGGAPVAHILRIGSGPSA